MGGRFGKYGDAKRKAQIRETRLRPPANGKRRETGAVQAMYGAGRELWWNYTVVYQRTEGVAHGAESIG